jgi:hypothetical protein
MAVQTTGILNEDTLSDFVDLQKEEFSLYMDMVAEGNAKQLYIVDNIPLHTGNTKRYKESDVETFGRLKREGEDAKKASVAIGYYKDMTFRRFAMELDITKEMRDDCEYTDILSKMTSLRHFIPQRLELDLTHRLTFASASSYVDMDGETISLTMGDGQVLCYAAHTLSASSTTYRNRVANDPIFSAGAYELAQSLTTTEILSNFGEKRVMNFNTIITGDDPNTRHEVAKVLKSSSDTTQNNSGVINPLGGESLKHIVLPQLATTATGANDSTKRRYWFIAATGQGTAGWQAYFAEKEAVNMKTPEEDVHNDNWTFGVRGRYGIAIVSGRGVIGSLPTA